MAKKTKALKTARLDLQIDPKLKAWAKKYARDKHTSLSAVVANCLRKLRDSESGVDVGQI